MDLLTPGPAAEALAELSLVDHHCHGVLAADLTPERFEALASEGGAPAPRVSNLDSPMGVALRRYCAPVLDLPRHAPGPAYLGRRAELGWHEVNRRFLIASGTGDFYVDTGLEPPDTTTPDQLAAVAGGEAREVVRLESLAEGVAASSVEATGYASQVEQAVQGARAGAVGFKSVAAYRTGFALDPARPAPGEIATAAGDWLAAGKGARGWRLDHPVLVRHLLWTAVDAGLPLQLHTGFGDADIRMPLVDPTHLTDWLHRVDGAIPVLLLHCWPYQRQASYLAHVFPNVYLDLGLTLHFAGPARAGALLAEALEMTPFHKMLYSSDAYGLSELYLLGATAFRRGLAEVLDARVAADDLSAEDAVRLATWVGRENARRVYRTGAPA